MKKTTFLITLLLSLSHWIFVEQAAANTSAALTDEQQIRQTLAYYIQGSSFNRGDVVAKAFTPEANLYLSNKDKSLRIVPVADYLTWYKKKNYGKFLGRVGEIVSIDISGEVATAKAEIIYPAKQRRYLDHFLLMKISGQWKITSKTAYLENANNNGKRILFIVSNSQYYGKSTLATGNSFSELVNAYDTFKQAGYTVDFVSPQGGAIPLAYINTSETLHKKYLYSKDFMAAIGNTKTPKQVNAKNYQAVHYIGGGSAMFGIHDNTDIQNLVMSIYEDFNGVISAVCHGSAGLLELKTQDGKYLVAGKIVTGYPDAYEDQSKAYFKHFPLLIQKTIEKHQGTFNYAPRNTAHIETDGRLVTGQNYLSSALVASKVIELLEDAGK